MNKRFTELLKEYLDSECSDYDMEYDFEWIEDYQKCEVTISRDIFPKISKELYFRYNEKTDSLEIELCEDSFYETKEYDWSVKYFWMLVSPTLFPNN